MSYLWSDKVVDYYYSNPELDTVAVLWKDEGDIIREYYIKVDEADEQWRDFVKEFTYEEINLRTEVRHESFREEFREAFKNYSMREDVNLDSNASSKIIHEIVFDFMNDFDNTDVDQKEELFKLKLKIFEQDVVKNSKSIDKFKNAKTFIRKADNPMDVMLGYMVFTSGAELKFVKGKSGKVKGIYLPTK